MQHRRLSTRTQLRGALCFSSSLCCLLANPPHAVPATAPKAVRLAYKYRPKQVQKFRKMAKTHALIHYPGEQRPEESAGTMEILIHEEVLQVKEGVGAMRIHLASLNLDQSYPDRRILLKSVNNQVSAQVNGMPLEEGQIPPGILGAASGIPAASGLNTPVLALRNPQGQSTPAPGYPPAENAMCRNLIAPLLAFPDRLVRVGESWRSRGFPGSLSGQSQPNVDPSMASVIVYKLKAIEKQNGAQIAVVEVTLKGKAPVDEGLPPSNISYGGTVCFDIGRGAIVSAQLRGSNDGLVRTVPLGEERSGELPPQTASVRVKFTYDISEVRSARAASRMKKVTTTTPKSPAGPKQTQ